MKRPFHIVVLLITLLWICIPQRITNDHTLHQELKIRALQAESGLQVFLINLSAKVDIGFDFSLVVALPDPPQVDFIRLFSRSDWRRDYGSFIVSHHVYTQFTSSYL